MRNGARILALGLLLPTSALASLDVYSDRSAWLSAAGTPSVSEDFTSFTEDTSFRDAPVALAGGMSIQKLGSGGSLSRNFVDVAPYLFSNPLSNHAEIQLADSSTDSAEVMVAFGSGISAFGFRTWEASGPFAGGTTVEVYDGASLLGQFDLTDGSGAFAGFHLSGGESASHVIYRVQRAGSNLSEGFALDELEAVPEPGTLAVLGLVALMARRRKGSFRRLGVT